MSRLVIAVTLVCAMNVSGQDRTAGAHGTPPGAVPSDVAMQLVSTAPPAVSAAGADQRFGIAHIDLMDLHVARTPAGPRTIGGVGEQRLAERYRLAAEIGGAWHRTSLYWDLIENDGFDWTVADGIVARDVAHGFRTLAVLQGNPPGVARVDGLPPGTDAAIFITREGKHTDDPAAAASINPDNPWARFVGAAVERYKPGGALARERGWPLASGSGVRAWEIGNEPNLAHFWPGTPADYARFLEVAYLVIEHLDPRASVVHGGIADDARAASWYGAFLDALKVKASTSPLPERYGWYTDATVWHWYRAPSRLHTPPAASRALLRSRGLPDKPLWVTEVGMPVWSEYPGPCWDPGSPRRASLAEQAGFAWQAIAEGLAAGAQLMIWFQLYDDCGNGPSSYDAFGLLRNPAGEACWEPRQDGCWRPEPSVDGLPRPAYEALRAAYGSLAGATFTGSLGERGGSWFGAEFVGPTGRAVLAWSTDRRGALASVSQRGSTAGATLFELDEAGVLRRGYAQASDGFYRLRLPGVTNRNGDGGAPIVDGRPVLLVERAIGAGASGTSGVTDGMDGLGGSAAAQSVAGLEPVTTGSGEPAGLGAWGSEASSRGLPAWGASSMDSTVPLLAVVEPLPVSSGNRFDLSVMAADDPAGSGLGAFVVYFAADRPPAGGRGWTPVGGLAPWPGSPRAGRIAIPFEGLPGRTYYFTAQASDRAGNWTPQPDRPQAWTRISGPPSGAGGRSSPATTTEDSRPAIPPASRQPGSSSKDAVHRYR